MAKKKKKVYIVLRKRNVYKRMRLADGDCYYTERSVDEFVDVFDNKEDAICCALKDDNCYVEKCKL